MLETYNVKYWVCDASRAKSFHTGEAWSTILSMEEIQSKLDEYTQLADTELRATWQDYGEDEDWCTCIGEKLFDMIKDDALFEMTIDFSTHYNANWRIHGDIEVITY